MNKKSINVRELLDKYQANCDRINEIADACDSEKRERTEAETKEYTALARENQMLEMRMRAASEKYEGDAKVDAEKILRENVARGEQTKIVLVRDMMMVADATQGGIIPVRIQDIVDPLQEGLIFNKVGLPFSTGLSGDFVWPIYEAVEATLVGEGVALTDTKISLDKVVPAPERMGIAIPVTKEAINRSEGVIENIVRKVLPNAIALLINKIMFGVAKVNQTTNLAGPFVKAVASPVSLSSTPTFTELNRMKAQVLEEGVEGSALCWVMTKTQEAILEGTPINSNGIYKPIAENHMMCGLPIFTTNAIRKKTVSYQKYTAASTSWAAYTLQTGDEPDHKVSADSIANALALISSPSDGDIAQVTVIEEYIGLGDWRYQPAGMFGAMDLVVDPFSLARKHAVDFVLNANFATKTLHEVAFKVGKVAAVSNA